ncbi:MAG: phospholipase D-like domain-containing protein [Pseudomonadota bacterium]
MGSFQNWFSVISVLVSFTTIFHIALYKRNSSSAVTWTVFILLTPLVGSLIYAIFGINRINRRLKRSGHLKKSEFTNIQTLPVPLPYERYPELWKAGHYLGLHDVYSPIKIYPFLKPRDAVDAMLSGISNAKLSITLLTYIFNDDPIGLLFINALKNAAERGVEIKLLCDDVGSGPSKSLLYKKLHHPKITIAFFLPVLVHTRFSNMRNHRKLMIVDGKTGFTGGMNIAGMYDKSWRKENLNDDLRLSPDTHYQVEGPVVAHLQRIFEEDWFFTTEEKLTNSIYWQTVEITTHSTEGSVCRVIASGPSDDRNLSRWHYLTLIQCARKSIIIQSPYFSPDQAILDALSTAALRGVRVDILIPQNSDYSFIRWVIQEIVGGLLQYGVHIWWIPGGFDHTKALLIDDEIVVIGSANWDARSLRINFELNLEILDDEFAKTMHTFLIENRNKSTIYTIEMHQNRTKSIKLRDGISRLLTPFL